MKLAINIGGEFFKTTRTSGIGHKLTQLTGLGDLISLLIKTVFVFAGVSLLVFFILGGIGMIASAGSNNPEKAEKSKKTVTSAVIGFVVVFVSYWLVQLIELWTGIKIL